MNKQRIRQATPAEKEESKARIDKATDHELGQLYMAFVGYDPFERYKKKLMLPSQIRQICRESLKGAIDKGLINAIKNE